MKYKNPLDCSAAALKQAQKSFTNLVPDIPIKKVKKDKEIKGDK